MRASRSVLREPRGAIPRGYSPDHPKDRHVLAAAVVCGAQTIVTFNLKDFPEDALVHWNVEAQSPDEFLIHQYHLAPEAVFAVVENRPNSMAGGNA